MTRISLRSATPGAKARGRFSRNCRNCVGSAHDHSCSLPASTAAIAFQRAIDRCLPAADALLASHRGYDAGRLEHGPRTRAAHFRRAACLCDRSRLLVDLNRSVGHRALYSDATRGLTRGRARTHARAALSTLSRTRSSRSSPRPSRQGGASCTCRRTVSRPSSTAAYVMPTSACSTIRRGRASAHCAEHGARALTAAHRSAAGAPQLSLPRRNDGLTLRTAPAHCSVALRRHRTRNQPEAHHRSATLPGAMRRAVVESLWHALDGRLDTSVAPRTAAGQPRMHAVKIRVGYELIYECPQPTPMVLMLNVHYSRVSD